MKVRQLAPVDAGVELGDVLRALSVRPSVRAFSADVLALCDAFSRTLFKDPEARQHPEFQALAFWMRRAELTRLAESYAALATPSTVLVPRGLVFHLPPSNVDTIFVYSWLLSVLVGNRNIIRLSTSAGAQSLLLARLFARALAEGPESMRASSAIVQYGHEAEITRAISEAADIRVIWGGDRTVQTIRAIPLAPHAKELVFPDRYSLSAVKASAYLALDEAGRKDLASKYFNDVYWFDQMACSSPRLMLWCGAGDESRNAAEMFWGELAAHVARKGYRVETATRIEKYTHACGAAIDMRVAGYREWSSELTVVTLASLEGLRREACGGGMLLEAFVPALANAAPHLERRDQTLGQFGFSAEELREFAAVVNGAAIDRVVPMGQALDFNRYWDGYDLLEEMSKRVYLG